MTATESQTDGVQLVTLRNLVGHTVSAAYRLDRVLGEGGMGIVFEATQLKLDRRVALKALKLDGPNAKESFARFERELAILSNLSHPNIVRVLDSGHDQTIGVYYIAMDLIDGVPLGDLSDGHRFAPAFALEIIYQIAGALAQPHSEGVIHRDLKPDNVLIEVVADETVQARLVDFGIARAFSADKKLTATGVVVGTPHYMAPELVREKELDHRADIYALGVMLHEMLTGSLPFDGGNFMQIGFKHVQSEVPSLASKIPEFDIPDLESLVSKMMEKEAADRFESVSELRRAIEKVVDDHGFPRVRVDPNVPVVEAVEHLRTPVDGSRQAPDSSEWVPQSTPQAQPVSPAIEGRHAGEHQPLSTTTMENVAASSTTPLIVALIAVVVALIAVFVAIGVSQNKNDTTVQPPTDGAAVVADEKAPDDPVEVEPEAPVQDDAAVAGTDKPDTADAPEAPQIVQTTPTEVVPAEQPEPPKKVRTKPPKKKPTNTTADAQEKNPDVKSFEEGLDWVSGSD